MRTLCINCGFYKGGICLNPASNYDCAQMFPQEWCDKFSEAGESGAPHAQEAKADAGKPRLTLVPRRILYDIAAVREYAVNRKYKDPDNWRRVEAERYRDALMRHLMDYLDDPEGVDAESGLPHLSHVATNVAFLCQLAYEKALQED